MKDFKHRNTLLRVTFFLFLLVPLVLFNEFYQHFSIYLTGRNIICIVTGEWHIVIVNIILFLSFLIPLSYRRRIHWTEYGLVSAFFVSLFVEMYGIPFTLLFISKLFENQSDLPARFLRFSFLGRRMSMDIVMFYGIIILLVGTVFIMTGWITLYKNIKKNKGLITSGIYKYSRHPQYFGFILVIGGWFIGWPTILTACFSIILIYKYIQVCRIEEKELFKEFPEYKRYKTNVPFFI